MQRSPQQWRHQYKDTWDLHHCKCVINQPGSVICRQVSAAGTTQLSEPTMLPREPSQHATAMHYNHTHTHTHTHTCASMASPKRCHTEKG